MSNKSDFENSSSLLDNASVSIHYIDQYGTILWANDQELEILGYSEEEYIGKNIGEFIEDKIVSKDILQRLLNGEKIHNYPVVINGKDCKIYFIISSNVYLENNTFIHTRCFNVDIPKEAYEIIKEDSEYFKN